MKNLTRRRIEIGVLAMLVIVALVGYSMTRTGGATAQDTEYLENFNIGPSPAEELERERNAGVEGEVHIPPDNFPSPDATPEAYGPFYIVPQGWIGPEDYDEVRLPDQWDGGSAPELTEENIRASDLWREGVELPSGFDWTLANIRSEGVGLDVLTVYTAPRLGTDHGTIVLELHWGHRQSLPIRVATWPGSPLEKTTLDEHPALIRRPLPGGSESSVVRVFDEATGIEYTATVSGLPTDELVDVVRSLIR